MSNSPKNVLSRLIHSDYFDNIIPMYMKDFQPKIDEHRLKCMHPICVKFRDDLDPELNESINVCDDNTISGKELNQS